MIVCVDFDNILNDLTVKVITMYNARNGKNIKLSDITAYNFSDCLPKEDADGIVALFKDKELWDSLRPLAGAKEALRKIMKRGHKVYIATATDSINFDWKCQWIERYFPFISSNDIIRIMDKSLLQVDVMIDDHLSNLTDSYCERICLDYPWNQSESKDYAYNIKRVNSWSNVVNIIDNIEKEMKEWEKQ